MHFEHCDCDCCIYEIRQGIYAWRVIKFSKLYGVISTTSDEYCATMEIAQKTCCAIANVLRDIE